jgi:hypothetical protein
VLDGLAMDAILLGHEAEHHVGGLLDAVNGGGCGIVVGIPNREGDVLESEGV